MPPICYNERVKKVYHRRFAIFSFSLGSFIHCILLEFEATSQNTMFVGRVVVFFGRAKTQFTYCLNE